MSKRDWTLFPQDMLESIGNIAEYTSGMGFQDFLQDRRTWDAVVRNLEVLGENELPTLGSRPGQLAREVSR